MSIAAAHDHGPKRFGAHFGAMFNVRLVLIFSFSSNYNILQADGSGSTVPWIRYNRVSLSAFPQMHDVSLQWRHDETRRKLGVFQPMTYMRLII